MMQLAQTTMRSLLRDYPALEIYALRAPLTGTVTDRRVQGYLLGLTQGVLREFSALRPTPQEHRMLLEDAFAVLARDGSTIGAELTLERFHRCDDEVIVGALIGRRDALRALEHATPADGLDIIQSGDEQAILDAIRPTPP